MTSKDYKLPSGSVRSSATKSAHMHINKLDTGTRKLPVPTNHHPISLSLSSCLRSGSFSFSMNSKIIKNPKTEIII